MAGAVNRRKEKNGMKRSKKVFTSLGMTVACALVAVGLCSPVGAEESIAELLRAYDHELLSDLNVTLEASSPLTRRMDPEEQKTAVVSIIGKGKEIACRVSRKSYDRPHYVSNARSDSYTEEGQYVVPTNKTISIYLGEDGWLRRYESESLLVSSGGGEVVEKAGGPVTEAYPVGHQDPPGTVYKYLMAVGRGFSQLLDEVTKVEVDKEGIAHVEAKGRIFDRYPGTWVMEIDTNAGYLVRRAEYTRDGVDASAVVCEADVEAGTVDVGDVPIYRKGRHAIIGYTTSVSVTDYVRGSDAALMSEIAEECRAGEGTVLDYNLADGEGYPLVTVNPWHGETE